MQKTAGPKTSFERWENFLVPKILRTPLFFLCKCKADTIQSHLDALRNIPKGAENLKLQIEGFVLETDKLEIKHKQQQQQ